MTRNKKSGFSLVEVNMAIFVMAMGILSMAVLFPLGLREVTQGTADLKQASFGDYLLNQCVAAAQATNVTWTDWEKVPEANWENGKIQHRGSAKDIDSDDCFPKFIRDRVVDEDGSSFSFEDSKFHVACVRMPGYSGRRMAIMVQSTEQDDYTDYNQYSNNPIYFAEAYFRGDPLR